MHLFDKGWNALRETIFANQKRLGVIPQDAQADPVAGQPAEEMGHAHADEKKMFIRQVEVYAAYLAYTDHEIGRVIQAVEDMGKLDNTLIIYISGDNGSSAEGHADRHAQRGRQFNGVEVPVEDQMKYFTTSGARTRPIPHGGRLDLGVRHAVQVDQADRVALRRHAAGHGVSWPGHIKDTGGIRNQFHHVIDIVPTILEATGIRAPETVDGIAAEADRRREHGVHL